MTVIPLRPGASSLSADEAAYLARRLEGVVLLPEDPGYAEECATANLAVTYRPLAVIGAVTAEDVRVAVDFARRRGLPIGVMATGYGASRPADGALLINTRRMNNVSVDLDAATVRAEAGVRWRKVVDAAAPFGLAPVSAASLEVGVVGSTLGGGLSPVLGRSKGWAADHVRAIELVTSDGVLRRIGPDREEDLFWAIRGGKGNFGVVTAIEFDLFDLPRLYGGGLFFDGEYASDVLHAFRYWVATMPEGMSSSVALLRLPSLPSVPQPLRDRFAVHVRIAYLGSAEEGERLVAPMRALGPTIMDTVREMRPSAVGTIHHDITGPMHIYDAAAELRELTPEAIDVILRLAGPASDSPLNLVEVRHLGGALRRGPRVSNAVAGRDAEFQVFAASTGEPDQASALYARADEVVYALGRWWADGINLNFLLARDVRPNSVRRAFDHDTYDRLVLVKKIYDPDNMFRINHNIAPSRRPYTEF
jgi:FAD/FMN-containing dehydrogenase